MILSMRRWKRSGELIVPPNMLRWFIEAGLLLVIGRVVSGCFFRQDGPQTMRAEITVGQSQGDATISIQTLINGTPFGLRKKGTSPRKPAVKIEVLHPGGIIVPDIILKAGEKQQILIEAGDWLDTVSPGKTKGGLIAASLVKTKPASPAMQRINRKIQNRNMYRGGPIQVPH